MNNQRSLAKPITTHTQTYAFCTDSRHDGHKRIATFSERGLLALCKLCHSECLISWEELDRIRAGFAHQQGVA
jgi:hypothetical protein